MLSMGRRCIVAGCSNTTKIGVSLHKFSSDVRKRKQWIHQVRKNRADWKEPSAYSVVCSDHFTEDCFEGMAEKLGLKIKRILKPDAVPTIFPRLLHTPKVARVPTAYAKRERARVSLLLLPLHARAHAHSKLSTTATTTLTHTHTHLAYQAEN